jgi:2-hydroxychromene-2-carboxylate isomerase
MTSFALNYDYRCPFAKNIHLHVIAALRAGAELDVQFEPWTLSQGHRAPGEMDVWDNPERDSEHLALFASISVRDQQPNCFLAVHEAFFRARHHDALRLNSWDEIAPLLQAAGADVDAVRADVESRRCAEVLAAAQRRFERAETFGTPTFLVDNDATFVRYMSEPEDDEASATLITSLVNLMSADRDLNEFKHTRLPA